MMRVAGDTFGIYCFCNLTAYCFYKCLCPVATHGMICNEVWQAEQHPLPPGHDIRYMLDFTTCFGQVSWYSVGFLIREPP